MKDFIQSAEALQEELVTCRRHLHQSPEIGLELPNTTAYVIEMLKAYGYAPTRCGGGVVATCGKGVSGKTFMLRADMDALPIKEESGEPFSATNGNMHACGHDFHTTMLLGCAKLLKQNESAIEGTVKLMFQPGEEVALGAKTMIEAGVLKNPEVDAAMMIHVLTGAPGVANGDVVVMAEGAASSNTDAFRINVKGKGGHGATPHETVDPINVMAHVHTALQVINAREVNAAELFTMTIGEISAGSANNVIPDTGYMRGTIRSFGKPTRAFVKARLAEISESVAKTFRAEAEVVYEFEVPSVINEGSVRRESLAAMQALFGDTIKDASTYAGGMFARITGSEDFGYVSEEVPSLMVGLVAGIPADGHRYPMHHPMATFDERVLWKGAAVYAHTAMTWLKNNQ